MAAGFTIRRDKFDAFRVAFLGVAGELLPPDDLAPSQRIDLELPLAEVNTDLERLIRHLEPCGAGNPAPVFGVRNARAVGARRVGTNHLRFTLDDGSGLLPAIGFRWADEVPKDWLTNPLDVAFRLERDDWQGRTTIQARGASLDPDTRGLDQSSSAKGSPRTHRTSDRSPRGRGLVHHPAAIASQCAR